MFLPSPPGYSRRSSPRNVPSRIPPSILKLSGAQNEQIQLSSKYFYLASRHTYVTDLENLLVMLCRLATSYNFGQNRVETNPESALCKIKAPKTPQKITFFLPANHSMLFVCDLMYTGLHLVPSNIANTVLRGEGGMSMSQ